MRKTSLLALAVLPALLACPPDAPPPPKVPASATVKSFSASPTEVEPNEKTTLSWEVENATSLSLKTVGGKQIGVPEGTLQKGTVEVEVAESTVFVLNAFGEGGGDSAVTSVVVAKGASTPLFAAFPATITAGESTTLVWNAPGASQVVIKDAAGQTVTSSNKPSGSFQVTPTSSTTYQLVAGEFTQNVEVSVELKINSFVASPSAVEPGGNVTLHWSVGGADKVTLEAVGRGEIYSETDPAKVLDGSFSEAAPTSLPSFGVVRYVLKAERGNSVSIRSLDVYVGSEPRIVAFNIPLFVSQGQGATLSWKTALANHVEVWIDGKQSYTATSQGDVEQGSLFLPAIDSPREVEFKASNATGGVATRKVTVAPIGLPSVDAPFTASPSVIAAGGDPVTLTWRVINGRHAKITTRDGRTIADLTGTGAEDGSVIVYPNKHTEYVLVVDNTVGDAVPAQSATADVTTPARIVFDPPSAPAGAAVTATHHTVPGGGEVIFGRTWKPLPGAFEDISKTGTAVGYEHDFDVTAKLIDLGKTFNTVLFGKTVGGNKISIANNGWFFFNQSTVSGPDGPSSSAPVLPSTALEPYAIAPFFVDLYSAQTGEIYWKLDESGPDPRVIVQWDRFQVHNATSSEVTMQAQVYASGKLVFAYKTMTAIPSSQLWSVGVVNGDESDAAIIPTRPVAGDGYEFVPVPVTLPAPFKVPNGVFTVQVALGNGQWMDVDVDNLLLPARAVYISEVNYNPATGKGEWFELSNETATPLDLNGWKIDFGSGNTHTITSSLVLPAGGSVLLGQDADAAEASTGGPAIHYVYGTALTMPNASGSVSVSYLGGRQTVASWTSAGTQGKSLMIDAPNPQHRFATATGQSTCVPTTTYGSGGQFGTPGAAGHCFPWKLAPTAPNGFTPIGTTGTAAIASTGNKTKDSEVATLNFVAAGGRAVKIGNTLWGNATNVLTVSTNGWVSMGSSSATSTYGTNIPSTSSPNNVLAPFWDDLAGNAGTPTSPSGIYWQQFDPDATPDSGDEYTLISWENWRAWYSDSNLNFQVKILEGTGDVEFHYGTMQAVDPIYSNGMEASAWMESSTGAMALVIGASEVWVQENSGWRFTYWP